VTLTDRIRNIGPFLRSFIALGALNYAAMALGLVLTVVLTRRLGVEDYGRLAMVLMLGQVLLLATANWTHIGFVRFGSEEFSVSGRLSNAFWSRMLIAAPCAVLTVSALVWWRSSFAAYLGVPVWAIGVVIVQFLAVFVLRSLAAVFQARQEMARYGAMLVLEKAAVLILVVALPLALLSVSVVVALYAVGAILVVLVAVSMLGRQTLMPVECGDTSKRMFAFSLPLLISCWAGFFGANWFDFIIIRQFRPVSDVGLYSLGWQVVAVAQQITVVFSTLLLPKLSIMVSKGETSEIRGFLETTLPRWLITTSILFIVILLTARWVLPAIFGHAFEGSAPVLALLVVASSALALFNSLVPLVSASGLTWALSGVTLLSASANVLLNFVLIPSFGIIGSAWATVLAYSLSAGIVLMLVHRRFGHVRHLPWFIAPVPLVYLTILLVPEPVSHLAGGICAVASVWGLVRLHRFGMVPMRGGAA
jgi:O-antigen/teichoic acid export membrane protein